MSSIASALASVVRQWPDETLAEMARLLDDETLADLAAKQLVIDGQVVERPKARRAAPTQRAARKTKRNRHPVKEADADEAAILELIAEEKSRAEIIAESGLADSRVGYLLRKFQKQKRARVTGRTQAARWKAT